MDVADVIAGQGEMNFELGERRRRECGRRQGQFLTEELVAIDDDQSGLARGSRGVFGVELAIDEEEIDACAATHSQSNVVLRRKFLLEFEGFVVDEIAKLSWETKEWEAGCVVWR